MTTIIDSQCSKCKVSDPGYYYLFIGNWTLCEPCLDKHAVNKHYKSINPDNIYEALDDSE